MVFNGYSPLGRADWTRFEPPMRPTLFEEPALQRIATQHQRSVAQILLRWNIQQGVPTQARSMNTHHMAENLDIFSWSLSDAEMEVIGSMEQCNITRGDPFMDGDFEVSPQPLPYSLADSRDSLSSRKCCAEPDALQHDWADQALLT